MARPVECRQVGALPRCSRFKPQGIPARELEELRLAVDELEALRLADMLGLYHGEAAEHMGVSRATFGRILESARRKTAEALVSGKMLRIEGGNVTMNKMRVFKCADCGHNWQMPCGTGCPEGCPSCKGVNFKRIRNEGDECDHGHGHGHGHGECHHGGHGGGQGGQGGCRH